MMLQRLMLEDIRGKGYLDFDAASGEHALASCVAMFLERGQGEFTKLVPDLAGIDPDDSFSSVPYEKGFFLLCQIRDIVGDERFRGFFHDYIQTFKVREGGGGV